MFGINKKFEMVLNLFDSMQRKLDILKELNGLTDATAECTTEDIIVLEEKLDVLLEHLGLKIKHVEFDGYTVIETEDEDGLD